MKMRVYGFKMPKADTRKAINFDLDTKELLKYFKDTREPYSEIKNFMEANGFDHRQYSGYISKEPISELKIIGITEKLNEKFKWLKDCIQKYDVTEIGETFDLKYIFDKAREMKNK